MRQGVKELPMLGGLGEGQTVYEMRNYRADAKGYVNANGPSPSGSGQTSASRS